MSQKFVRLMILLERKQTDIFCKSKGICWSNKNFIKRLCSVS